MINLSGHDWAVSKSYCPTNFSLSSRPIHCPTNFSCRLVPIYVDKLKFVGLHDSVRTDRDVHFQYRQGASQII